MSGMTLLSELIMEGGSGWQELLLARAPQNLLSKSSPANLLSIKLFVLSSFSRLHNGFWGRVRKKVFIG